MDEKKHDPSETLIDAMSHMDNVTHALAIVAFENGNIEVRSGYMPNWMIIGLLREALAGYEQDVEPLEEDN